MGKVRIISFAYNRADLVELQLKTLRTFLEDDFEYILINDAEDKREKEELHNVCHNMKVTCIDYPQNNHRKSRSCPVSDRHRDVIHFGLTKYGYDHDDIVVLFDNDLVITKPFSIRNYMKGYDAAALPAYSGPLRAMWTPLVFLNMPTLPNNHTLNFEGARVGNRHFNTGGATYYYLKKNPHAKVRWIPYICLGQALCGPCSRKHGESVRCPHMKKRLMEKNIDPEVIEFAIQNPVYLPVRKKNIDLIMEGTFIHFRAASYSRRLVGVYSKKYLDLKNSLFDQFIARRLRHAGTA